MKNSYKILIAEDEAPLSKALETGLVDSGLMVKTVFDGANTIKELLKNKYDLLLLDIIMPKKDGFEVLSKIKSAGIKIPVIVLTNLGQEEDEKMAISLGANKYLVKSNTSIAKIIDSIKIVLNSSIENN